MHLIRRYHMIGSSLLILAIVAFAIAQHVKGPLTIPIMDSMAAAADAARSADSEPLSFPFVAAASSSAEAPSPPSPTRDQLLGEVHVNGGDAASRPADPTPAHPLRIDFALGAAASVRVGVSTDDGVEVATVLTNPSAPAGPRVVEWSGANSAGSPVPSSRFTLTVEALQEADVYRLSVHSLHLYIARPGDASVSGNSVP